MKKILLINNSHIENFSVRNIACFLKQKGFKVSTIHYKGEKDDVFNLLSGKSLNVLSEYAKDFDLVGISLLTTHLLSRSIQITKHLKKENKSTIIWGGVPVICDPEYFLKYTDYVCAGEGEQLLADLLQGKAKEEIKGLGYISKSGNPIINPIPDFIDLNVQPIPHLDIDDGYLLNDDGLITLKNEMPKSLSTYSVLSVRGCPFQCSYCLNSKLMDVFHKKGSYIRKINTSRVIEELLWAKNNILPLKRIVIDDDDFFLRSNEEMDAILNEYARTIDLPIFYLQAHIKHITELKIQLFIKHKINLRYLKIGLQSGSQRISKDIFNRNLDKDLFIDKVKLLVSNKIRVMIDLISDNPYETFEDKYEALLFYSRILKIVMESSTVDLPIKMYDHKLMYYPGSKLYNMVLEDKHIQQDYIDTVLLQRITLRKKLEDIDTEAFIVGLFNLAIKKKRHANFACIFIKILKVKPIFRFIVRFNVIEKFSFLKQFQFFNNFLNRIKK
jgi:anaerobic magnesium-protoporphyrin IX monomethyl ester cyclase